MKIESAKVAVVGLARSGLAVAEFLRERGATVIAIDSRPLMELEGAAEALTRIGAEFRPQSSAAFAGADWVVVSPGVPAGIPELEELRQRGVTVIGEVELAGQYLQGPVIGITGANGKTTTTALTGHILARCGIPVQVGGNIGRPVTAMLAGSRPGQFNVLELSSFQLETIETFAADIAVALNVTPDHLDRHGSFDRYANAKARLFETQRHGDFAVLNRDDATCVEYSRRSAGTTLWFSTLRPINPGLYADSERLYYEGRPFLAISEIPLRGRHNVENTLAAAAAAVLAGVPLEGIAAAVRTFPGVEHRLEFVRRLGEVDFYNDSKATNVDATLKAVAAFDGPLWIILGGKDKGSDYTVLQQPLRQKAKAALLIGAAAGKIAGHLGGAVPLIQSGTLEQAVRTAWEQATVGDTVLLAPACASFDQFQDFEHRGRAFKSLVASLKEKD